MKIAKNIIKILSLAHIVFWLVLLIISVVEMCTYTGAGEEPLGLAMERGIRTALVFATGTGAVVAGMLSLSVFRFLRPGRTRFRTVELGACVLDNLLLYTSAYFVFFVNSDAGLIVLLAWLLCTIVCGVLLAVDS